MVLSQSALIVLAFNLSQEVSVNDLRVYNALGNEQKAIVLELIESDIPPAVEKLMLQEKSQEPSPGEEGQPPVDPVPRPTSTRQSYDVN